VSTHIRLNSLERFLQEMDALIAEMNDPAAKSSAQLIVNLLRRNYNLIDGEKRPVHIRKSNLDRALRDKEYLVAEMADPVEKDAAQLVINLIRRKYGLLKDEAK